MPPNNPSPSSLTSFPAPDATPVAAGVAPVGTPAPCWSSSQLLGGQREAHIVHAGTTYRLRLTALGKLILTK